MRHLLEDVLIKLYTGCSHAVSHHFSQFQADSNFYRAYFLGNTLAIAHTLVNIAIRHSRKEEHCVSHSPKKMTFERFPQTIQRDFLFQVTHEKQQHMDFKPFQCKFCEKTFTHKYQWTAHEKRHEEGSTFQCQICEKSLASKRSLIIHMKNHSGNHGAFKCTDCAASFTTRRSLNAHRNTHYKEDDIDQDYGCDSCQMVFASDMELQDHMDKEHDETDAKCDLCNQEFVSRKAFAEHMLEHQFRLIKEDELNE